MKFGSSNAQMTRPAGIFVLWLIVIIVSAAPSIDADDTDELDVALGKLAKNPGDVDIRLRVATLLTWRGRHFEAHQHLEQVVKHAPRYWDAQLLLARIDAWNQRYDAARMRLLWMLSQEPKHRPARALLLDVAIWSEQPDIAKPILLKMLAEEQSAELYFRLALVEQQRLHYLAAYRLAQQTLKLNRTHQHARNLIDETVLAQIELAYQFEAYPVPNDRFGHGSTLVASVLPRSFLSAALIHEIRYRFGTFNNRLLLQGDYRLNPRLQFGLTIGGGFPAKVIPQLTIGPRVNVELTRRFDGTFNYIYDRTPWAGDLHRFSFVAGAMVSSTLQMEGGYTLGLQDHCGNLQTFHGVHARGVWQRLPWGAYAQVGFGTELDRPTEQLDPTIVDANGCPIDPNISAAQLLDLRSYDASAGASYQINKRITIKGGYAIQFRFNGGEVHTVNIGGQYKF